MKVFKHNDFAVSGTVYDDEEAIRQLKINTPDAVILDISLDSLRNGIEIAKLINASYRIPYLFLTSYYDKETLERAKAVEPSGYIVKPFHENTLLASVKIAIYHARLSNYLLPKLNLEKINKNLLSSLTERELEVLQLIYNGKTNSQIASQLFVSINTIKVHIRNAYLKLDTETRTNTIVRLRNLMIK